MFDIIYCVDNGVWLFGNIEQHQNCYRVYFVKMIHNNLDKSKSDEYFEVLEKIEFKTPEECLDVCNQILYQIQEGII